MEPIKEKNIVLKALESLWFWFSLLCTLFLFFIWILAFFTTNKEVILNINMYGEALIEMAVWVLFLCLGYYGAKSIREKIAK